MKNFRTYISLLLTSLFFISCATETFDEVKLIKQVVEIAADGTSITTSFAYSGSKIVSRDSALKHVEFTYTSNLITKITVVDKVANHSSTFEYSYKEGNLVSITSSDNYTLVYNHNADGSVSYEKWSKDPNNEAVKMNYGTLTFDGANLVKDEKTIENKVSNTTVVNTSTFTYDGKKNALSNIVGFKELLNYSNLISATNAVINIEAAVVTHKDTDEATSSMNFYNNEYKYDEEGYPVEITGQKSFFGDMANHKKTLLYY
jgi:hypothetical protein